MAINWVTSGSEKDKESSALQQAHIISDNKDSNSSDNILKEDDEHASNSHTGISLESKKRPATDLTTTTTTTITTTTTTTTITTTVEQQQPPLKKQKLSENIIATGHNSVPSSYCLDMSDAVYFRDRAPLMPGCKCLACRYKYML